MRPRVYLTIISKIVVCFHKYSILNSLRNPVGSLAFSLSLAHQARLPALDSLPQEVPLLCLAPRHHLAAQGVLQLERVRHLGHDVDDRSHDLGRSSLGDRSEERRRRLEQVHHVREPGGVVFRCGSGEGAGERKR